MKKYLSTVSLWRALEVYPGQEWQKCAIKVKLGFGPRIFLDWQAFSFHVSRNGFSQIGSLSCVLSIRDDFLTFFKTNKVASVEFVQPLEQEKLG